MQTHNVIQGSDEWHALRRAADGTASEASVMMGASKNMRRDELLAMKKLGAEQEISEFKKRLFDKGHEAEANTRPHQESDLGESLYPITGTEIIEGLTLLASYDGMTFMEDRGWECKLWNEEKAAQVRNGIVPKEDIWQVIQQSAIGGMIPIDYTVSDGTPKNRVTTTYTATEDDVKRLIAGWRQFHADLETYQPPEYIPAAVAKPQTQLPAVVVNVEGVLQVNDNLTIFKEELTTYLERINRKPETDQDFADLDATIKTLVKTEDSLSVAKGYGLAQVEPVDTMCKTIDNLHEITRKTRLELEKLSKARKANRKAEIIQEGEKAFNEHLAMLRERLGGDYLPEIAANFANAVKGRSSFDNMKSAVNDMLAQCKITANALADKITINLQTYEANVGCYGHLFNDIKQIVLKENDDFKTLVKMRIVEYEAAEEKRREAEREQMRREEQAKAQRETDAKLAAEREQIRKEEEARANAEAQQKAAQQRQEATASRPTVKPVVSCGHGRPPRTFAPEPEATLEPSAVKEHYDTVPAPKPNDADILAALKQYFGESDATIIGWLKEMDLDAALESAA